MKLYHTHDLFNRYESSPYAVKHYPTLIKEKLIALGYAIQFIDNRLMSARCTHPSGREAYVKRAQGTIDFHTAWPIKPPQSLLFSIDIDIPNLTISAQNPSNRMSCEIALDPSLRSQMLFSSNNFDTTFLPDNSNELIQAMLANKVITPRWDFDKPDPQKIITLLEIQGKPELAQDLKNAISTYDRIFEQMVKLLVSQNVLAL